MAYHSTYGQTGGNPSFGSGYQIPQGMEMAVDARQVQYRLQPSSGAYSSQPVVPYSATSTISYGQPSVPTNGSPQNALVEVVKDQQERITELTGILKQALTQVTTYQENNKKDKENFRQEIRALEDKFVSQIEKRDSEIADLRSTLEKAQTKLQDAQRQFEGKKH
eukprot:TRINITY_DN34618_c0_g1_i1.p1 TRINITY_DN34618_c0_g1~~TRINITY_DN34618_c0_g1_i1.p1  ORF type:complete len:165 (+),score=14.20 TRINITY_DN34618_c0_g1_i1:35-529(+)